MLLAYRGVCRGGLRDLAAKLDGLAPMGRRRSGSELETGGRLTMRSFQRLIGWAGSVGRDPLDNPDRGLRKRLAVLVSIGTMPMTIGWSLIYLAAGDPSPRPSPPPTQSSRRLTPWSSIGHAIFAPTVFPSC